MGSEMETAFREFLLDPDYWKPRLKDLSKAPRELAMFPRPDLARSTLDVTELGMLAHDGSRLRGLLVRPARRVRGEDIDLVASEFLGADAVPWKRAEGGVCVLVYELGKGRRLEDRVL
ncbi:MAG: cephalosporin-C deacetylase-like acetyl esterase, partial [Planctomycetota bacterium]